MQLSATFTVITLAFLPCLSGLVQAQGADYLCYWQNADGSTRDLAALCQPQRPVATLSPDAAFLANYQLLASQYAAPLNQQLQNQDRDDLLTEASVTCRMLRVGGITAEVRRRKAIAVNDPTPAGNARRQIIRAIAPTYYCPEFANR